MTPEQQAQFNAMVKANADAHRAIFDVLSGALAEAKRLLREARKPLEAFNEKAAGFGKVAKLINHRSQVEGSRAGLAQKQLHREVAGITKTL